jgi:hypothetical protein
MPKFETADLVWPGVAGLLMIQIIISGLIFFVYPFLAWIFFGEGGNSILYTETNVVIWIVLPILLQSLLNGYRIYKAKVNRRPKTIKAYAGLQVGLLLIYSILVILWSRKYSFHM